MRGSITTVSLLGLVLSSPASAAWPDDVTLSNLDTWNGQSVQTPTMRSSYERVVTQLAVTMANKPMAPARTLGVNGFDVALTSTIGFIESGDSDPYDPSPWERVHETGSPSATLWIPGISVRKGLPMSFEAGANVGYVAFSHQTTFGGYGRWAPLEGYGNLPDVALQLGYSGYIGNEELALSATDGSISVGYSIPIGKLLGIHTGTVSPYGGVGYVRVHASPQMSASEQEALGIRAVSGSKKDPAYEEGFSPLTIHGGMRILSGDFQVLLNVTAAPGALVTLNSGLGFVF